MLGILPQISYPTGLFPNTSGLFLAHQILLVSLYYHFYYFTHLRVFTRAQQLQLVLLSSSCSIVFFQFSSKVQVFIFLFAFLQFYPVVSRNIKVHYSAGSFFSFFFLFFFFWLSLGLIVWLRFSDPFVSQSQRVLCVSFSMADSRLFINHSFVWSNLNFLHNS